MSDTAAVVTITEHAFTATPWHGLCAVCRTGVAAHATVAPSTARAMAEELGEHDLRCPACVQLDRDITNADGTVQRLHTACPHRWGDTDGSV